MTQDPNPLEKLMTLWTEGAKTYTQAIQSFFDAFTQVAANAETAAPPTDPAGRLAEHAARWSRALGDLSQLQSQLLAHWLESLPRAGRHRLDAQTFSQLDRLAQANWDQEARRLSELPSDLAERAGKVDAERLSRRFQSMLEEYLRDLDALDDSAFNLDVKPLVEAWTKVLSGSSDEAATRVVERFLQALSVKTRYGVEYYADPERTRVGQTPRELVHRQGKIELYRYLPRPEAPPPQGEPVLLVYSVINRSYILDLIPGNSFIGHLLDQGLDVYLVEWGPTDPGDRVTTLDSYIEPGLTSCVAAIRERTGAHQVSLFGHCIGGNLALMVAALHPETVSRLVILTTPVTSAQGGVVALWTDRDILPIDAIIDTFGHMPAKLIRYTFMALKPYYEVLKWKMFYENLGNEAVMAMFYPVDRWANDNVDVPGEVFRKFVHEVLQDDRFRRGETLIHGRPVDLGAIRCPLLNLAASADWIVRRESAELLNHLVSSQENHFVLIEGAHVAIMMDPRTRPIWNRMSDFLLGRTAGVS